MSDLGINYSASVAPSPVGARVNLGFSGQTLRATLSNVDSFVITLTPSGNISNQILSGIAWPVAQTLGLALGPLGSQLIENQTFNLLTIKPASQTVAGSKVEVTANNPKMTTRDGMLEVTAKIAVD